MNIAKLSLLAWSMLTCAHTAFAKTPEPVSVGPSPLGSPGSWVGSDDYPAIASFYDMAGVTSFRLSVDATGKPSRCDIVESSGFDVLDRATCERLMANARFSPPSDRAGKPTEGTYTNRVRWVMPEGGIPTVSENFESMLLSIDEAGNVTSCRIVLHVPTTAATSAEKPCGHRVEAPLQAVGMEFRGNYKGASAEVEIQQADVFTPALRARVLSPMPGYEQRALNVYHFTVTKDGKLGQCSYEEQRGSDRMVTDYCGRSRSANFDPPFAAFDKDGVASGWHIMRVLLKNGQ